MKFIYLLAILMIVPTAAVAQLTCIPRADLVKNLTERYNEHQTAIGLESAGEKSRMVEIFVSSTGSFTILLSYPNGLSCVAASGEGWRKIGKNVGR
jgi:hypothetical protein